MYLSSLSSRSRADQTTVPGSQKKFAARLTFLFSFLTSICSGDVFFKAPINQESGAVASESKVCSEIGINLLKKGVGYHALELDISEVANSLISGKCSGCARWDESLCGCNRYVSYSFPQAISGICAH